MKILIRLPKKVDKKERWMDGVVVRKRRKHHIFNNKDATYS